VVNFQKYTKNDPARLPQFSLCFSFLLQFLSLLFPSRGHCIVYHTIQTPAAPYGDIFDALITYSLSFAGKDRSRLIVGTGFAYKKPFWGKS